MYSTDGGPKFVSKTQVSSHLFELAEMVREVRMGPVTDINSSLLKIQDRMYELTLTAYNTKRTGG